MGYWEQIAQRAMVDEDVLELTASRLITEQVLYAADSRSKIAYELIYQYTDAFNKALSPIGYTVSVNAHLRYAYAIPQHNQITNVSMEQTLLALVLRKIFDEEMDLNNHMDNGEVICDLITLQERYRIITGGRELAKVAHLRALLNQMKRWGIVRISSDEQLDIEPPQPFTVIIRPGILEILGETALIRLAKLSKVNEQKQRLANSGEDVDIDSDDEDDEDLEGDEE